MKTFSTSHPKAILGVFFLLLIFSLSNCLFFFLFAVDFNENKVFMYMKINSPL